MWRGPGGRRRGFWLKIEGIRMYRGSDIRKTGLLIEVERSMLTGRIVLWLILCLRLESLEGELRRSLCLLSKWRGVCRKKGSLSKIELLIFLRLSIGKLRFISLKYSSLRKYILLLLSPTISPSFCLNPNLTIPSQHSTILQGPGQTRLSKLNLTTLEMCKTEL